MTDPTLNPPQSPNRYPFAPVAVSFAAYLAAGNHCECSPTVDQAHCPIHAYDTGHHYPWEASCAINKGLTVTDALGTRPAPCTCPPKLPSELPQHGSP